ncbi:hypothetical protein ACFL2Q_12105 [Thermodesulfobacteriota bacterium]
MQKETRSGKGKREKSIKPKSRFSEKRLTSRAGLIPMARFLDKLGIEGIIACMVWA